MKLRLIIALPLFVGLSPQILAQDLASCGDLPIEPAIIDGATSTLEQLIANSTEVKAYVAEADQFLDCSEARYKRLSSSRVHKAPVAEQIRLVTARRNEISDEFNGQVAAFRAANPQ